MGREKRKGRLNKTGDNASSTGAFIGFGAFANAGGIGSTLSTVDDAIPSTTSSSGIGPNSKSNGGNKLRLSPIYTGSDQTLTLLFPKIGQKRDATTKAKALLDLLAFFQSGSEASSTTNGSFPTKKTKAEALSHFLYLFQTKLNYDNAPKVRANSVRVCVCASECLPKAWTNLTSGDAEGEIHGMLFCARADAAAEVRNAAAAYPSGKEAGASPEALEAGLWRHAQRILSYHKPVDMHMDLFQKKGGGGGGNASTKTKIKLSESQQEELEERYERIVGTAIEGLRLYLLRNEKQQGQSINLPASDPASMKYLWRTIASPKASLRRQTYALLSTVCQSKSCKEPLVDPSKMAKLLSQSLASEKESINIGILLETVLAFVASFYSTKEERAEAMLTQFAKPLSKLFKKGCHGASPATSWTPTLLPLVALLPIRGSDPSAIPPRIDLLTHAWEGQNHVVSTTDKWEVISAVAETASFLLAREESTADGRRLEEDQDMVDAFSKILAKCWIRSLLSFLSGSGMGAASRAHRKLGGTLAKGWIQLDSASFDRKKEEESIENAKLPSIISNIREWFWKDALVETMLSESTATDTLTDLLLKLNIEKGKSSSSGKGAEIRPLWASDALAKKFQSLMSEKAASWVPTLDIYELWISIAKLVVPSSPNAIFGNDASAPVETTNGGTNKDPFDSFVMNRLLPWLILHTSSRSDRSDTNLALCDVRLVYHLSPSSFGNWWEPLLRELLKGEPDLEIVRACLVWLSSEEERWQDVLGVVGSTNSGFSSFCISVGKTAISATSQNNAEDDLDHSHDEDSSTDSDSEPNKNEEYHKTGCFLRACVGLDAGISGSLVGDNVVDAWIDFACPNQDANAILPTSDGTSNPVLDTLVAMIQNGKLSDSERIKRVVLQSWRQGDKLWEDQCLPWLSLARNAEDRSALIHTAGQESSTCIEAMSSSLKIGTEIDDDTAWAWTERAYRLLRLCSGDQGKITEVPSLGIIGLGGLSVWEDEQASYLSTCLMRLIQHMDDSSSRWQLFVNSEADTVDLFVTILIALSGGDKNPPGADLARRRKDSCATLLAELDFQSFEFEVVQESIECCISKLLSSLKGEMANSTIKLCKGIAVLSQLIELHFIPLRPRTKAALQEKLNPENVRVGDKIWYITKAEDPSTQEPCTLVKIHRDLPEEVYFTIRLDRNGSEQERQTLGERLRSARPLVSENTIGTGMQRTMAINEVDEEGKLARLKVATPIVEQLINSIDVNQPPTAYELYSIAIAQCGLLVERGIGSLHYSVVQKVIELQRQLMESLSNPGNNSMLVQTLWRLALALGFGQNVPASKWVIALVGSNAADTVTSLIEYDGDEEKESTNSIECAMAAWLSVCSPVCEDVALRSQSYSLLFDLAARLLASSKKHHYIALRAIEVGQAESHKSKEGESVIQDSEAEALTELTKAFSMRWNSDGEEEDLQSSSIFDSIMRMSLSKRQSLMAIASRKCTDALAEALYNPSKQYYATKILFSYAKAGRPLFEDANDDDLINIITLDRLDEWAKNMLEDEAEELEDDVACVAQWVCGQQMIDVESWHEDDDIDDEIACGRMLSWLSFLEIADAATGKDAVNRLAFTSYVSICKAVDAMLDLAIIYCNIGSERKVELDVVISMEKILESMSLSKLAARVIFRSVEVFPTLSKNWWDSSCPKYLTQSVREFVEKQVSPDILKLAVKSIQNATAFGEMQVQGGSVSREVNATYVQDDFTLSVAVKLPLSFPLQRAEVDCSKTLGVPKNRWKRWSLQITQMLNNQGGTLKDALLLWKENVDKEFEGVEPCPVCYSVLHVKSHKLPNLECNTCHNQFHHECLYEWFRNSGKTNCVICQTPWSGTRIDKKA